MVGCSAWRKNNLREIRHTLGRFFAIAAIIALGVGFFAGLKATPPAMIKTGEKYVEDTKMFDLRCPGSYVQAQVDALAAEDGVSDAQGQCTADLTAELGTKKPTVRSHSLSERINLPMLTGGRMPVREGECLGDDRYFTKEDIGQTMHVTHGQMPLLSTELKIVGLCSSPLYLGMARGTTTLADGSLDAFVIVHPDSYAEGVFTDIYLRLDKVDRTMYSERYDKQVAQAQKRLSFPYVLSRQSNSGYVSLENDSQIIERIGRVFPVFFFAVAALVCMTTMSRMVTEQRTLIGTLKALGYSDSRICMKYMSYAAMAALGGCLIGFWGGTWLFPYAIWTGYYILYRFAPIEFYFSASIGLICLLASLLCSVGTTWFSCRTELRTMPSELMRPRAPKPGKRIFLERIPFVWNRFSFLWKVSVRNIIRYKKRLVMMLLGISGCTALIVTGLGLHDSISTIVDDQFSGITHYQLVVSFGGAVDEEAFRERYAQSQIVFTQTTAHEIHGAHGITTVQLIATQDASFFELFETRLDGKKMSVPQKGVLIDKGLADALSITDGDELVVQAQAPIALKVAGRFNNHIYHYGILTPGSFEAAFGVPCVNNTAYLMTTEDPYLLAAELSQEPGVLGVTVMDEMRQIVSTTLDGLSFIIAVVIGCACALAVVVLFNLCNISITERIREIATVKVLGFHSMETQSYVFREVLLLTVLGAILGLPLGFVLHRFVMKSIVIDIVSFHVHVSTLSYVLALGITLLVGVLVCVLLSKKLERIDMAESLKSVE
ncbi:MAG: ABC transporter permease [Ruminococcaceae bacterium]|nr:ABC transporter permease [Oscillospiraceae bacterium]